MRGCLQVVAGFVALFFVVSGIMALFLYNFIGVATDRDTIKQALTGLDEAVKAAMPLALADMVQQTAVQQGLPAVAIDEAQIATAVTNVLPPGWIEAQTDTAVDGVYNFLETGDTSQAELSLDMSPLLESLRGQGGQQLITAVIEQLPPCSQPIPDFDPASGNLPACLPPQISSQQLVDNIHTAVVDAIDNNPQWTQNVGVVQIPLFGEDSALGLTAEYQVEIQRLQQNFLWARTWAWTLWLVPLAALLLIVLLAVRSLSDLGHWWGWPMVITAVVGLSLSFLGPAVLTFFLRTAVRVETTGELIDPLRPLASGIITTISDQWLGQVMWQAGLMFVVGAALIAFALITNYLRQHMKHNPHIEYR